MEEIARKIFAEERTALMEEIQEQFYLAYQQAIEDFLHALQYDIESVVQIGIDGCRDIFEDKKAQKYISDHILQEIMKRLKDKNLRKWYTDHRQVNKEKAQTIPRIRRQIVCALTIM